MTTYSSDELAALFQSLADNLCDAGIHYRLFRDLVASIPRYSTVFNQARAFWTLTLVGHRDAAVFRLCRVYDTEPRALGVKSLLQAVRENQHLFDETHFRERLKDNSFVDELAKSDRTPSVAQIEADLALVGPSENLVKKLIILRNNVFAHTSPAYAVDPSRFKLDSELEERDIWALIDRALDILNRYSGLFFAQTYTKTIVGHDDYTSVLDSLERDWLERERQIYEELKAAGALDIEGSG